MNEEVVILSLLDRNGAVVGCDVVGEETLETYGLAAKRARKLHGDLRAMHVDRGTADELIARMHVAIMEKRRMTFDDLLALARAPK
jgi:hypothetical protein